LIVSCESCKSRYKLDDSKVSGRGAKITCPKCKHVFVVYSNAPEAAAPAATSPNLAAPPNPDEDEPTRIGMSVGARATGGPVSAVQFGGGGVGIPMSPPISNSRANPTLAIPLPDPAAPSTHVVGHGLAPPPPPPSAVSTILPGDANGRAAGLDFRKVGVTTWKVKVRIGLIYDFSDIKTLRKYITDGRVTAADVISYDGKNWKPIGEIPDLDTFFLDTYERLLRERGVLPPPEARTGEVRTPEANGVDPRQMEPEPNQFRDPFDDLKSRQRDRLSKRPAVSTGAAPRQESRGGLFPILVVLLLAAAAAGGVYVMNQRPKVVATPTAPPKAEAAKPGRDQEREKLRASIEKQFVPVAADPETDPGEALPPDPVATDPGVKVLPDGRIVRPRDPVGGSNGSSRSTTTSTSSQSSIRTTDASSTDYEAIGDASARAKDWKGAAKGYQDAVNLDPGNARLLQKLGEAQYRSGQLDAAQATLRAAADKGQKAALKLLGNIAREQGDVSEANAMYQQYLASNPKDASDVEKILREMNGG
jgi:predicted Zn finger-like uncharacterized protein